MYPYNSVFPSLALGHPLSQCYWSNPQEYRELWPVLTHCSLPGRFEWNFREVSFKLMLMINGLGISCEIAVRWMSLGLTDDKSALVQVMAWSVRERAIIWTNVDPDIYRLVTSLGHNELIKPQQCITYAYVVGYTVIIATTSTAINVSYLHVIPNRVTIAITVNDRCRCRIFCIVTAVAIAIVFAAATTPLLLWPFPPLSPITLSPLPPFP